MANEKRLIDANAFAKSTVFVCGGSATDPYYNGYTDALDRVEEVLANFPTVDAVPVVRCKDCRWAEDFSHSYLREVFVDGALNCVIARGDSGYGLNCSVIMPHDFCSDGERREGE